MATDKGQIKVRRIRLTPNARKVRSFEIRLGPSGAVYPVTEYVESGEAGVFILGPRPGDRGFVLIADRLTFQSWREAFWHQPMTGPRAEGILACWMDPEGRYWTGTEDNPAEVRLVRTGRSYKLTTVIPGIGTAEDLWPKLSAQASFEDLLDEEPEELEFELLPEGQVPREISRRVGGSGTDDHDSSRPHYLAAVLRICTPTRWWRGRKALKHQNGENGMRRKRRGRVLYYVAECPVEGSDRVVYIAVAGYHKNAMYIVNGGEDWQAILSRPKPEARRLVEGKGDWIRHDPQGEWYRRELPKLVGRPALPHCDLGCGFKRCDPPRCPAAHQRMLEESGVEEERQIVPAA